MSNVYFHQNCRVCGRGMRVRVELLGKKIACAHCFAVSVANDGDDDLWARRFMEKRIGRLIHQQGVVH